MTFVLLNIQQLNCVLNKFDEFVGCFSLSSSGVTVKHNCYVIVAEALTWKNRKGDQSKITVWWTLWIPLKFDSRNKWNSCDNVFFIKWPTYCIKLPKLTCTVIPIDNHSISLTGVDRYLDNVNVFYVFFQYTVVLSRRYTYYALGRPVQAWAFSTSLRKYATRSGSHQGALIRFSTLQSPSSPIAKYPLHLGGVQQWFTRGSAQLLRD